MNTLNFGPWTIRFDADKTRAAFARKILKKSPSCKCEMCRDFTKRWNDVFPPYFSSMLNRLGIEPADLLEVNHNARLDSGLHAYGGKFTFVGEILSESGDNRRAALEPVTDRFALAFSRASYFPREIFQGHPAVQLEFSAEVPWISDRPEPSWM